jgi:dTDP-D-glucose 4,6-dehydratase
MVLDALTHESNLVTIQPLIDASPIQFVQGDVTDSHLVVQLLEAHGVSYVAHLLRNLWINGV